MDYGIRATYDLRGDFIWQGTKHSQVLFRNGGFVMSMNRCSGKKMLHVWQVVGRSADEPDQVVPILSTPFNDLPKEFMQQERLEKQTKAMADLEQRAGRYSHGT